MLVLIVVNAIFAFQIRAIDWRAHVGGFVAGVVLGLAVDGFKNRERSPGLFIGACTVLLAVAAIGVSTHGAALRALYGPSCF